MMDNGREAADDQGNGWFEVKKKHRSSSKFSLENWVGGFSGKNTPNSARNQHSSNWRNTQLGQKKQRQNRGIVNREGGCVARVMVESGNHPQDIDLFDKSAVKQDTENSNIPSLPVKSSNNDREDDQVPQLKNKPDVRQKIKWGDLEEDALVVHQENTGGAGIKFGIIDEDSLCACHRNDHRQGTDLHGSCCTNLQHTSVGPSTVDVIDSRLMTPLVDKDESAEENLKDSAGKSSEGAVVQDLNGQIVGKVDLQASNCKDVFPDLVKSTEDEHCNPTSLSSETSGAILEVQEPKVVVQQLDSEIQHVLDVKYGLSVEVALLDTPSVAPEKSDNESSVHLSMPETHSSAVGSFQHDLSKAPISSSVDPDSGESKERFRERLWCFLFENLNRAVDELYLLCELECDLQQMKEAILVLEEAASDFKELTSRAEEFETVKRSTSQSVDGSHITLKNDHRRPHAISWEVRRMTTSPHRAEILSSSLEAFNKIQLERANQSRSNDVRSRVLCYSNHGDFPGDLKKKVISTDSTGTYQDSSAKSRKQSKSSDVSQGKTNGVDSGKSSKASGRDPAKNSSAYDLVSSRSAKDCSGRSRRECISSETEKLLLKKDRISTENTGENKNLKAADHIKRSIPPEKDKDRKNAASWKTMDAWKERRNWEDILSSPFRGSSRVSHSPGIRRKSTERVRTLHEKLMTPEKRKKTSLDLKKEAEEKHARAMRIRNELENERVQKLQRTSEKLIRVTEWQAVRTMKLREGMYARHQRSELRHEAYIAEVVRRAGDESSKVKEVRFITSLNDENKKFILHQKLHDSELRRTEKLQVMRIKHKEDMAREEAVSERRKLIEAEKLQRLAETQRKKEEAQLRREEERKASSAAREARAIEQLRRKEERARAQQEEAELLAQKLAEKLNESEQRRKVYLEQIRERASMDFRDQSSPLLRRPKEGIGRSTPTNNGDDYQAPNSAIMGTYTAVTGNGTLQHSLKRRIKRIRQRLMALKYEYPEHPASAENPGIGYRTTVGTARVKVGRWLQELQKLRQARKGAPSIGLITAEMIKFLEGKDPELDACRQAGLLDFIASALPASHTSKPEACQLTIHLLKLLRVVLSAPANRSYFLAQNLLPPVIPMLSAALENYIKIAASLNVQGSISTGSAKASVEIFESISEVLDGFLWTVSTIIGHVNTDERQLQMRDGLLELLVAYRVIHRLRDLFALYDRPQVEGLPFPSSILLSINLLVVLTSSMDSHSFINCDILPNQIVLRNYGEDVNITVPDVSECSKSPVSVNCSGISPVPDVLEDRCLNEVCRGGNIDESILPKKDVQESKVVSSVKLSDSGADKVPLPDELQGSFVEHKDGKHLFPGVEEMNDAISSSNRSNVKQPVAFLLSAISDTGLVSLPSLLTSVLLQANNRSSSEQVSDVLPSNFEEVATGVLKVLNSLALLDLNFMQGMLATPDLKMEFFHMISFLLSHCSSRWKVAHDQIGSLLLESILLLGHFAWFHSGNQAVLRWGKSPTILHKVCDLPFVFFSDPELMPILAATLVAACYGCEQNKSIVQQELSMDMLLSLLRSCRNVPTAVRGSSTLESSSAEDPSGSNQQGSDLKNLIRSSRISSRCVRAAKAGPLWTSARASKMRSQRDRPPKAGEETVMKRISPFLDTSVMLHSRLPYSFINRAEQFFSGETVKSREVSY